MLCQKSFKNVHGDSFQKRWSLTSSVMTPGNLLEIQILSPHLPDLLTENFWGGAQPPEFYPGDSDAWSSLRSICVWD
jgi:hypothetical protein